MFFFSSSPMLQFVCVCTYECLSVFNIHIGLNFISFVYQHMSNYIYKQAYMIYKTGFRRKSVDLFESVSHFAIAKKYKQHVT